MEKLYPDFSRRMKAILARNDYRDFVDCLSSPPLRYARVNPVKKVSGELIMRELGGFPLLPEEAKPGLGALHSAGAYYVQEPAAAAVAKLIIPYLPQGAKVLDMCAAPGGKVTAAASERSDCAFLANEIVFSRAKILMSNIERLGLRNCTVTSLSPDEIVTKGKIFDAVVADVPCSGEGMLRKADFGRDDLSDASVAACVLRARKILDCCDACLCEGGILAFSTCTFNTAENEEQVRYMMQKGYEPIAPISRPANSREGIGLPQAVRFFPQDGGGEGHFCCLMRKTGAATDRETTDRKAKQGKNSLAKKNITAVTDLLGKVTAERFPEERITALGEGCELLPENYPFAAFPALRRGVRLADFEGGRVVPHHNFATAADPALLTGSPDLAPDSAEIAAYLAGDEFGCDSPDGFRVVRVAGITLGMIKVSGGRAKNRYPKGLRIRR